ncbi:hypothetical protein GLE_5380 [Lysobacter enzymogenes]|uniref:Uncharacterized protein n=1 Tax=Lysobacter enzymogenes TaxID=69 RepID=A0A0S2DQI0_LYSEN|nr:hypothetical protein [Lysobacter enzymogenes]ALN60721.1 hypothetical protein GLE_5380 [Lysobacter enzymogenes]QCW24316.1 hypothetical protein FE772_00185 [Lysobacter enzymogenes]
MQAETPRGRSDTGSSQAIELSGTTLDAIITDIDRLKRQSQSAIPFGLAGLALVVGGLVYSGWQLNNVRRDIADKRQEMADVDLSLNAKAAQLAESEKRLSEAREQRESLQIEINNLAERIDAVASAPNAAQKNAELNAAMVQAKDLNAAIASAAANDSAPPRYGAYKVDIFYCADRTARNKPLAERARTLGQDGAAQGEWRVRELSEKSNASPGYGIRSDVIRFESDEKAMAGKLRDDVTRLTQVSLSAQQIRYETPNYISLFFCGEG